MRIKINFWSVSSFISVIVLVFFSFVFIIIKSKNRKANIIASLILLIVSYYILDFGFSLNSGFYLHFPNILRTSMPLLFLVFPLLYLYVNVSISPDNARNIIPFYQILPALIMFIVNLPFFLLSAEEKSRLTSEFLHNTFEPLMFRFFFLGLLIQGFFYIMNTRKRLLAIRGSIDDNIYSIIWSNINWLMYIVWLFMIGWLFICGALIYSFVFPVSGVLYRFLPVLISLFACILVSRALVFPASILGRDYTCKDEKTESFLNIDHMKYKMKLENLIAEQKVLLNPDLSLTVLAEMIGMSRNYTSFLINKYFHMSFYDFINKYRVDEVVLYMKEDSISSLLDLAFKAGFNSKTTFNVAFKKNIGLTPTEFRRKLMIHNKV